MNKLLLKYTNLIFVSVCIVLVYLFLKFVIFYEEKSHIRPLKFEGKIINLSELSKYNKTYTILIEDSTKFTLPSIDLNEHVSINDYIIKEINSNNFKIYDTAMNLKLEFHYDDVENYKYIKVYKCPTK